MKNLTVYRASAGSGKTFTLALEYIKLLVENPQSFRQTLAVTFTNKATEEMKMRILSDLYGISKGLKNSDTLLEKIKESTEFSEKQIRDRAWLSLQLLIHNYNYFRVETIDAFFELSKVEGIIPALESSHAVAWALREAPKLGKDIKIVVNVSGRGDKDADYVAEKLGLN